ncbi:hypothetical protein FSP39_011014 [Pinctada imbricata]|uniref:Endonuclease/exonuclease/phosphatase domain-containing protein n=1 Tax=Pinctada imbricata TaxID=66713 RepID=A0AA88XLY6_PINIB|nr:hypothetical protein FSP39_011014 [Pinctada imbricata]
MERPELPNKQVTPSKITIQSTDTCDSESVSEQSNCESTTNSLNIIKEDFNQEFLTVSLNICAFNCKNIMTSILAIEEIMKHTDILLIQEHWLFNYQLPVLNDLASQIRGIGKAVDDDNPISPIQKPRGYGGVAILWKDELDSKIEVLKDGSNRIQCIRVKTTSQPILLVSIYLPAKGCRTNPQDYLDCMDQLQEILDKYQDHHICIGGDFNEHLTTSNNSERIRCVRQLISDNQLQSLTYGSTFIHPNGKDSSEIDYFLVKTHSDIRVKKMDKMEGLETNTSDHHPIRCNLSLEIARNRKSSTVTQQSKINWDKVDKEKYREVLSTNLQKANLNQETIEETIDELTSLLTTSSSQCQGKAKKKCTKHRLKVWNDDIKEAVSRSKKSHWEFKKLKESGNLDSAVIEEQKMRNRTFVDL